MTLVLDDASQARFDALRTAHFPADRLVVGAHVTLFHALAADLHGDIVEMLRGEARLNEACRIDVTGLRFLGRGVAFMLQAPRLAAWRDILRQRWETRLTPQDRQTWQPHVTIQNKAPPVVARTLHADLSARFVPYSVLCTGVALWVYRQGPWESVGTFGFSADC